MAVYSVHEPPSPPADRIDRAEGLVFVKDGFSWSAAFLGPLWLAIERNWRAAAIYVLFTAALLGLMYALGASAPAMSIAVLAINIFLGFENAEIERDHFEAKGWTMLGTVSGSNLPECERRFFENWLPGQPVLAYPAPQHAQPSAAIASSARPAPSGEPGRTGLMQRLGLTNLKRQN